MAGTYPPLVLIDAEGARHTIGRLTDADGLTRRDGSRHYDLIASVNEFAALQAGFETRGFVSLAFETPGGLSETKGVINRITIPNQRAEKRGVSIHIEMGCIVSNTGE